MIYKSLEYRIYPNETQKKQIDFNIDCARYVYNHYLAERDKAYTERNEFMNYYACDHDLSSNLKVKEPWLKEADSYALSAALKNLDHAFDKFFKKLARHPVYKKKKEIIHSKSKRQKIKLSYRTRSCSYVCEDNRHIRIPKVGRIKARGYKQYPIGAKCKNITIVKKTNGKYFAIVESEFHEEDIEKEAPKSTGKIVGIDLGIRNLATTSDGKEFPNPKFLEKSKKRILRLNRALKRKPSISNNRIKVCEKLSTVQQKVINQRRDYINKVAHYLIHNYDVIFMEDLKVMELVNQKLGKGRKKSNRSFINKGIFDAGMYHLMSAICNRVAWYKNKMAIKIPRTYPSTRTCNVCGYVRDAIRPGKDSWICPKCKTKHNRDINAAKNIRDEGIRISVDKLVDFDLTAYSN